VESGEVSSLLVSDLDLPARASNCFRESGIKYLHQLAALTEADLLRLPNFGQKSLVQTRRVLRRYGHRLRTEEENETGTTGNIGSVGTSIDLLELSRRSSGSLKQAGIQRVEQLTRMNAADLLGIANLGRKSLWEIEIALAARGLSLGMERNESEHDLTARSHAHIRTSDEEPDCPPCAVENVPDGNTPSIEVSGYEEGSLPELIVSEYLSRIPTREQAVLRNRVFTRKLTLAQLAKQFNLTRERCRQIEEKLLRTLNKYVRGPDGKAVSLLANLAQAQLGAALPSDSIEGYRASCVRSSQLAEEECRYVVDFVLWAAQYALSEGWWTRVRDLEALSNAALQSRQDERGWLSPAAAREELSHLDIRDEYQEQWISNLGTFVRQDDGWLPVTRTIPDRVEQLLRYFGKPMTSAELLPSSGCESERSLRTRLLSDERFKRTSRHAHFALREWPGLAEYSGITDELVDEISRLGGAATVQHLVKTLSERFGVKPNSVIQYLSAPMFNRTPDGRVIVRGPEEMLQVSADPNACPGLYNIEGLWTVRVEVTSGTLRGSGRVLNPAVAVVLGCQPGQRRVFKSLRDEVVISWPPGSATGPNIGSLKPDAAALSAAIGDYLLLTFRSKAVGVRLLRAKDLANEGPLARLICLIGLSSRLPSSNYWSAIGTAMGLVERSRPLDADDIYAALMRRNEVSLAELVYDQTTASKQGVFESLEGLLGLP